MEPSLFALLHRAFHEPGTAAWRRVEATVYALIGLSVLLLVVELALGLDDALVQTWLLPVDRLLLWVFGAELLLRVASFRPPALGFFQHSAAGRVRTHVTGRVRLLFRPLILVDLVTVLAVVPGLRGLRAVRLLRLLRATRLFRYSNPFTGLARAFEENRLLFAFGLSLLGVTTIIGGLSMYLAEVGQNAKIESIGDGLWWALVTLTTVGYGDIAPETGVGRLLGGLLMVAGLFNLGLFAALVSHALVNAVLGIREEQFRMSGYLNHIVVCGYDPGARLLLDALLAEMAGEDRAIVLFAPGARPPDLPPEFTWISGDPTKESELDKVSLPRAAGAVLVAPRALLPQQADANTILTAFTLRAYMKARASASRRARPLYVVAEILDPENVTHARTAGADEVIETTRVGFALMAHATLQPGTAEVLGEVASVGHQSLYVGRLPGDVEPGPFEAVRVAVRARTGVLIIGLRDGGDDLLNPADDHLVGPETRLLYLASEACLPQ
ncbi:MAG: ion transporter [Myxococcales bacterium]|nr:ion transporter [Myxococcales bacterium]